VGRGDGACGGQDAAADSRRCGRNDAGVLPATNFTLVTSCGDRKVILTDSKFVVLQYCKNLKFVVLNYLLQNLTLVTSCGDPNVLVIFFLAFIPFIE
jgi:hypothetical protein